MWRVQEKTWNNQDHYDYDPLIDDNNIDNINIIIEHSPDDRAININDANMWLNQILVTCTKLRMIFFGSVLLTANVGQPSPTHRLISLSQLPEGIMIAVSKKSERKINKRR